MEKVTFDKNKLATTVGADSFSTEAVVSQPKIIIPINEEVEYEFDQAKYEKYLYSSSRSSTPRRNRRDSTRKGRGHLDIKVQNQDPHLAAAQGTPCKAEATTENAPTLSKRARQRRRQHLTRQLAKASELVNGIRYEADLKSRRHQPPRQQAGDCSKSTSDEWVPVKRTRSTLEERTKKRHALLAHVRILVQEARKLQTNDADNRLSKPRQIWRPKSKTNSERTNLSAVGSARAKPPTAGTRHRQANPPPFAENSPPAIIFESPTALVPVPMTSSPSVEPHDSVDLSRFKVKIADRLGPLRKSEPRMVHRTGGRT